MARKTPEELITKIELLRWLRWQCLRRNEEYKEDVENLLRIAKEKSEAPESPNYQGYAKIIEAYDREWEILGGRVSDEDYKKRRYQVGKEILDDYKPIAIIVELWKFRKKWDLLFPIDPRIDDPIEYLFSSLTDSPIALITEGSDKETEINEINKRGIEISLEAHKGIIIGCLENIFKTGDHFKNYFPEETSKKALSSYLKNSPIKNKDYLYDSKTNKLTVWLKPGVHKKIVMAYLEVILDTFFSKENKRRIQCRSVYKKYFKVWDLKNIEGKKNKEISEIVFPKDPNALVRVNQYLKEAEELINGVSKK